MGCDRVVPTGRSGDRARCGGRSRGHRHPATVTRPRDPLAADGSGSVLGIGIVAGLIALSVLLAPVYGVHAARQRAASAADLAALAAADTVRGILPGHPCAAAARTAIANRSAVTACRVEGFVVTVHTEVRVAGFAVSAVATAGPPRALAPDRPILPVGAP